MNDGISVTGEGLEIQSSPDNFASQTNLTHTLNLNVIRIADRIPTLEITAKHMNRITGKSGGKIMFPHRNLLNTSKTHRAC